MPKYRIIHVAIGRIGGCCWQAQKRVWLFFWLNLCGRTASATTQGNEILMDIHRAAGGQDE